MGKVVDMTERRASITERRDDGRLYGDILIARRVFESAAVKGRPASEGMLWIRVISEARFKDGDQLKRGQLFTNWKEMRSWIAYEKEGRTPAFKPNRHWFKRLLLRWKDLGMIETEKCRRGVVITIKKYDYYQARRWSDVPGQRSSEMESQRSSEIEREINYSEDIPPAEHPTTIITIPATTSITFKNDPKSVKKESQRSSEIEKNESNLEDIHGTATPTTIIRKSDLKIGECSQNGKIDIGNDVNTLSPESNVRSSQLMDNKPESLTIEKSKSPAALITYIIERKNLGGIKTKEEEERAHARESSGDNPENLPAVIEPTRLTPVETSTSKKEPAPVAEILEIFLSTCPDLPRARMTKNLKDQITARWREDREYRSLEFWQGYFRDWVSTSDFLNGESASGFKASIHWLTGPKNMAKVLAGNYVNREAKMPRPRSIADCRYIEKKRNQADMDRFMREYCQNETGVQHGNESRENGSRDGHGGADRIE